MTTSGTTGRPGRWVRAAQAAYLTHKNERTIRRRIKSGALVAQIGEDGHMRVDTEALARVPGWQVDAARLATLDAPGVSPSADERLRALERRVGALERLLTHQMAQQPRPLGETPLAPSEPLDEPERGPRTVTLADRGASGSLTFSTKTTAARWLMRHGIHSEGTPKSWPGWPPLDLTPSGVLGFALALQQAARERGDWRVTWRLHRCADPACVCRELLLE